VLYYNACILSELLERAERRQDYQRADAIKRANPASWKHVNLYGAYSFLDIGDGGRPPGIGQSLGGSPR
jgi:Tn3 transposase DDE domain